MKLAVSAIVLILAGQASAEAVSSSAARAQLFAPEAQVVQVSDKLSKADKGTIKVLIPLMEKQLPRPVSFFSSIAYSPDEGLASEALQGAFNFHDVAAADRAALRACNAARKPGTAQCRLAARILPQGYAKRSISLSSPATEAFLGLYSRAGGRKAFAVSPSTGAWGMGASDAGANRACAQSSGARDCEVVIRD